CPVRSPSSCRVSRLQRIHQHRPLPAARSYHFATPGWSKLRHPDRRASRRGSVLERRRRASLLDPTTVSRVNISRPPAPEYLRRFDRRPAFRQRLAHLDASPHAAGLATQLLPRRVGTRAFVHGGSWQLMPKELDAVCLG